MFNYTSIEQYHTDLLNGHTTCVEAVQFYLGTIRKEKILNAFLQVYEEESLQRAAELDEARSKQPSIGKLHGVVVALKDVLSHKDHPLTAASKILGDFTAVYNATAVERLIAEEAIIIGRTNCDEFAMGSSNENSAFGNVLNALDHSKVPGGSSGGSAVAVQADCCMVSLGSDTGGSVRQPADFCGVIGIKPTYGRISRYGLIAYASSFDQIGIFAKAISDTALVLEVISGKDDFDSTVSTLPVPAYSDNLQEKVKPLRIAYFREALESPSLDPEINEGMRRLITGLQKDGNQVQAIDFEYLDYVVPTYYILTTAEASSNLSRYDGIKFGYRVDKKLDLTNFYCQTRSEGFGWEVKKRIMLGSFVLSSGYYDAYFTKAQQVRKLLVEKTNLIFSEFDAIILPNAPTTAFPLGEKTDDPIAMYLADIFTVFCNLVGLPGISLPLFWHRNGLPYGVQVMTNRFSELYLLQLSNQWMQLYREERI
ncbi:MAG: Asp-tRNA(Asn)/Glu-tRNA(Gln) amidotransferase subunit GatA [Chitinophagaceae bacterium]|nr:Asp-tRNA(Asn)/Glu-tRNA(Gln) amidotransferase subunit GatA [Chitinophagaceae bacterium]